METYAGFRKWGAPRAGWFMRGNPMNKWMRTGGTPMAGNSHIVDERNPAPAENGGRHPMIYGTIQGDAGFLLSAWCSFSWTWGNDLIST